VFFLDSANTLQRAQVYNLTKPVIDKEQIADALRSPRLAITNLARDGSLLDHFVIRYSTARPHFYSPRCFEGAIVYGSSIWTSPEAVCKYYDSYQEDTNNLSIGEL
jgi:hypothetical protein